MFKLMWFLISPFFVYQRISDLEVRMTKEFDDLKVQSDRLKVAIADEIKQLADALDLGKNADAPAAIQAVANDLRDLADRLVADDAPPPAPVP